MSKIQNLDQNYSLKKIDKETINIKVHNNDILMSLVGEFNNNLNELEKLTKTKIFFRGNSITIKGGVGEINRASGAIKFLINKYLKTNFIEKQDLPLSVKEKNFNIESNVHTLDQLIKTPKKTVIARSKKQSEYIKALKENNCKEVILIGGVKKPNVWLLNPDFGALKLFFKLIALNSFSKYIC